MSSDHLSEVLDVVEVRGLVTGGFAARGRWVSRGVIPDPLKLFAMVSGHARLRTNGIDGSVDLGASDVAILNNRSRLVLEGGAGDGPSVEVRPQADVTGLAGADPTTHDIVLGIAVDLNPAGRALLLQSLPAVGHLRSSTPEATHLRDCLRRLFDEIAGNRLGSAFAIRQHCQLLMLEVLRTYAGQAELPSGWLRLLTDERLLPAVSLMHAEPGTSWGLEELARAAAMSRTSFAERFRSVAGVPPLTYLSQWRMLLAQRALRSSDVRIGSLATDLGYASESAFSTAFKRVVGESPLRYKFRTGDDPPTSSV